jgi:energy-coupling factor transport system permease protein
MSRFMLSYVKRDSPVHRLSGATKIITFLLWSILAMTGYDTRVMLVMGAMALFFFIISGVRFRDVSVIFKLLLLFMVLNFAAIYLFAPEQGVLIYGTRHLIAKGIGPYTITAEQLFYEFNLFLKYLTLVPAGILLIVTIQPSEFAASLNRIGVPYTAAYAVSLCLRYIPDIQRDYENISQAQQARGIELSKKASLFKRVKGSARILLPLIFSSLERIDIISRAMELRGFGKNKKRTWYSSRPFTKKDAVVLAAAALLFILGMWVTFADGSRFYNPWIPRQVPTAPAVSSI